MSLKINTIWEKIFCHSVHLLCVLTIFRSYIWTQESFMNPKAISALPPSLGTGDLSVLFFCFPQKPLALVPCLWSSSPCCSWIYCWGVWFQKYQRNILALQQTVWEISKWDCTFTGMTVEDHRLKTMTSAGYSTGLGSREVWDNDLDSETVIHSVTIAQFCTLLWLVIAELKK